jgi:peptidoglycan/LPS O-acetylase OafA/YrhL
VVRDRLHNLQVARFVAAGAILFTHTAGLVLPPGSPVLLFPWMAGVDLFFVISGFIMAYLTAGRFGRPGAAGEFLARRLIRIAPPYWIFTSMMVAVVLLLPESVRYTSVDAPQLATSYAFLPWPRPGDGALVPILSQGWTLNYEIFFYAAFGAALLHRRGVLVLAAGFVALAVAHPWIPEDEFMLRFWSAPIILEFLAGIALARVYLSGRRITVPAAALLAGLGIAILVAATGVPLGPFSRAAWLGVPALLVGAAFVLLPDPRRIGAPGRLLRAGGDGSYALYLSHTFTVNAALLAWRELGLGLRWYAIPAAMTLAIAAAILFYRLVERPLTDTLQRLAGTRPIEGAATVAP